MAREPKSLAGKVVAITGGARGIGRETAELLITHGARVAIGDIDEALVKATAAELGAGTVGMALDVTSEASFDAFLTAVERQVGPLEVLINNAGIMPVGPFAQESEAMARRIVDINLHGVLIGSKLAIKRFQPRGGGSIVNIASAAGRIGFPGGATYSATKFAVVGVTEALRGELRGTGIDTHVIMPIVVNTELGAGLTKVRLLGTVEPADVAGAIVDALQHGRHESYVPRSLGPILRLGRLLPVSSWDRMMRLLRADRVLARTDPAARAAYEARVLAGGAPASRPSVAEVAASVASAIDP